MKHTPIPPVSRRSALLGTGLAALGAGTLAACGSDDDSAGNGGEGGGGGGDTITIGYIESWSDTVVMAFVLKQELESIGYTVELQTLGDAALQYTALSEGDIDIYSSGWPDVTHASYMEQYGDSIEDLGTYNSGAINMLAVPASSDLNSIDEVAADPARFDGRIVGIEPGAGLTDQVENTVMPAYGMDSDFELVTSSTSAMLAELGEAIDNDDDIVVTLWKPFWANYAYDVKELEDPDGAFGEPETMRVLGRDGFAADFPEAAELIEQITLSDEEYESLEDTVINEFGEGSEEEAVSSWTEENPGILPEG